MINYKSTLEEIGSRKIWAKDLRPGNYLTN